MNLTVVIKKEGKWYTAWAAELDIVSQGNTVEEAIKNVREAVELYLEDEDIEYETEEMIIYPMSIEPKGKKVKKHDAPTPSG
ncbi:type II toxin-antitoxin system HicB family antitoxin [Candidatus Micrarchaeota archaeon]|nr:type II toxin-antitoxin system HicB family antitoxin [Candidatus Micrarchaeota archaeon]